MKELIILTIISGLTFFIFLVILILGLIKKNKKLKLLSLFLLFISITLIIWTGIRFVNKTYNKVTETLKPRTGEEIYDSLFDKRQTDCIKILNYQDQVIPKIDYAIWLHFKTCPKELKRILSKHKFSSEKLMSGNEKIPYSESLDWFKPTILGDTIIIYEYATENNRNIQTIWTNLDSTEVFVRDVLD